MTHGQRPDGTVIISSNDEEELRRLTSNTSSNWAALGKKLPRSEITFFAQHIIVYMVIIVCNIDLIISNGNSNLWTAFLSWCLAYLLSAPSMSVKIECAINTASLTTLI